MGYVILAIALLATAIVYACCMISGECARVEEAMEWEAATVTEKRLIDVYEAIERARASDNIVGSSIWETSEVVGFLEDCPIEDSVEVVHGRWEKAEYHGFLRCSECKDVYIDDTWVADGKWSYCPNCGAKMLTMYQDEQEAKIATDNNVGDKMTPTDKDTNVLTNADRIRAMTDEELVENFWECMDDDKFCYGQCNEEANCDLCRLAWLKQPAEVK